MAAKPSDFLHRLPTVSELLDKPPIRALASRWNRSVVAAGVRSFLEELRNDLERRAADVNLPSLRELAERAARHVVASQQTTLRPTINATGRLFGPEWDGVPLADEALERMVAMGSSFPLQATDREPDDAAKLVCRLTGAEAATVVHSYSGAIWLALAAIAAHREVVVARAEVSDVDRDGSLASIAAAAAANLREVGSVNRTLPADFETAVRDETAALWRNLPDDYQIVGEMQAADVESLVALARDRELPLVESLGAAPLVENLPALDTGLRSVAASQAAGTHLTIVRGNSLVGGPPCGILVGTRALVDCIESHPMFPAWRAHPSTAAALAATLTLFSDPQQLRQTLPLFQLLGASVENLRQRAERLAPQLAQAADVAFAVAVATENCLGVAHSTDQRLPSFAIALTTANDDASALDQRLRSAPVPVVCRLEDDRLLVDLRSVLARQDRQLVEMIAGDSAARNSERTCEENAVAAAVLEPADGGVRS
jgi:L-seryl-tRNA(Ser) seleniumtransferase